MAVRERVLACTNRRVYGNPIMHSTIGIFDVASMQKALEIIFDEGVFGETKITALEIYTYPMRLIKRFELKLEE